ncbi:MAG: RIO1 family regulatory kinase/ATPase [Chloroflexota bacterium]
MPRSELFPSDWLVPGERHEDRGVLKTGKEADVHLVARHGGGRTVLLAEKRFRPRERRGFRHDWAYRAPAEYTVRRGVDGVGPRREQRAMRKAVGFGREMIQARWIATEWENLVHLYAAGVTVPPPVELLDDGYRMAFIGDGEQAAPRLAEVDLDIATARHVWGELLEELRMVVAADRVHGDLSAYNVLWWRERPVLIDLSQTVDVITHPAARELLDRDLHALARYFVRHGVEVDRTRALAAVGADAHRFARQVS